MAKLIITRFALPLLLLLLGRSIHAQEAAPAGEPHRIRISVIGKDGGPGVGAEVSLIDARHSQARGLPRSFFVYHSSDLCERALADQAGQVTFALPRDVPTSRLRVLARIGDHAAFMALAPLGIGPPQSELELRPWPAAIYDFQGLDTDGAPTPALRLKILDLVRFCVPSETDDLDFRLGPDGRAIIVRELRLFRNMALQVTQPGATRGMRRFELLPRVGRHSVSWTLAPSVAPGTLELDSKDEAPLPTSATSSPSWRLRVPMATAFGALDTDWVFRWELKDASGELLAKSLGWEPGLVLDALPSGLLTLTLRINGDLAFEQTAIDFSGLPNGGELTIEPRGLEVVSPLVMTPGGAALRSRDFLRFLRLRQILVETDSEGRLRIPTWPGQGKLEFGGLGFEDTLVDPKAERWVLKPKPGRAAKRFVLTLLDSRLIRSPRSGLARLALLRAGRPDDDPNLPRLKLDGEELVVAIDLRPAGLVPSTYRGYQPVAPGVYRVAAHRVGIGAPTGAVELGTISIDPESPSFNHELAPPAAVLEAADRFLGSP